jgi:hypothetical protein
LLVAEPQLRDGSPDGERASYGSSNTIDGFGSTALPGSTQTCSAWGSKDSTTRPKGIAGLRMRAWTCSRCGVVHDRGSKGRPRRLCVRQRQEGRRPVAREAGFHCCVKPVAAGTKMNALGARGLSPMAREYCDRGDAGHWSLPPRTSPGGLLRRMDHRHCWDVIERADHLRRSLWT